MVEVQGYVYAAYVARAVLADHHGDEQLAREWRERAAVLKAAFNDAFWLPDRGRFALALDAPSPLAAKLTAPSAVMSRAVVAFALSSTIESAIAAPTAASLPRAVPSALVALEPW